MKIQDQRHTLVVDNLLLGLDHSGMHFPLFVFGLDSHNTFRNRKTVPKTNYTKTGETTLKKPSQTLQKNPAKATEYIPKNSPHEPRKIQLKPHCKQNTGHEILSQTP